MYILDMGLLPYRKHLEWLIIEGQSSEQIISFYDNIQMIVPTTKDIDAAKQKVDKLMIPPGAQKALDKCIYKADHIPVWEKAGYGELFGKRCGEKASVWEEIGYVLANPVIRITLESLIISKFNEEKMLVMMESEHSMKFSPESLALYKKYFANYSDFSRRDWLELLNYLKEDNYSYQRVFTALTKTVDEVLHLCGMPTQKQYSDFLKTVLATSDFKFKHYARQNSAGGDEQARKWAKVGIESGEKFEKYGASDVTDFSKMVQTEFDYVDHQFPTLDEALLTTLRPKVEDEVKAPGTDVAVTPPPVENPYGGV